MFSVLASGTPPLTCQWRREGLALAESTALTLVLTQVQTYQAGNYDAVISNGAGAVTSTVARLSVTAPPQLLGIRWGADVGAEVSLDAGTGPAFELLASTNLAEWTVVARFTNFSGPGPVNDPAASRVPVRFYRGRIVP